MIFILALLACHPTDPQLLGPFLDGDCDPISPEVCGLPFPSNVYLQADDTSPTGARVHFGPTTLPVSVGGVQSSPDLLNVADGFSPAAGPIAFLPGAASAGVAGSTSPDTSLSGTSPTIILDATTGERVSRFAELDESTDDDATRAILLRPIKLLTAGHRYIVALRHVVDSTGTAVAPSPAVVALRDGTKSDLSSVTARRGLYADIFDKLTTAGVDTADLQLAWDFTVASRENNTARMLSMRDTALDDMPGTYAFTDVQTDIDPHVARRIEGTVDVPLFLDDPVPGGTLVLGNDGLPVQSGTAPYPFVMLVPTSCVAASCPIVQYGHGLFGDRYAIDNAGYYEAMDAFGAIVISMDWIGMSNNDLAPIAGAAASGDISQFATVPDRSQQGFVNLAVALRTLETKMVDDPTLIFGDVHAVDPSTRYYIGGSQGGIYGASYMSLTPDIDRGALVVPGAAYSLMLPRSIYWQEYATPLIVANFDDPRDVQLVLGYLQMLWDRSEPSGYATAITDDPFPGTTAHRVMLFEGVGDHQVPNLSTELLARSIGASYLAPGNRTLDGLPAVDGPLSEGNALVDVDYGLPPVPDMNIPMTDGDDPHSAVFFEPDVQVSMFAFLKAGTMTNPCDGACDPE